MRKKIVIAGVSMVLALCAVVLYVGSYNQTSNSVELMSRDIASKELKIKKINEYLTFQSEVIDAEYILSIHDNSGFLSGPSDFSLQIALRMLPTDVPRWIVGYSEISTPPFSENWKATLQLSDEVWSTSSTPRYYSNDGNTWVVVFFEEGIVYRETITR
jgi:hypothetical protein